MNNLLYPCAANPIATEYSGYQLESDLGRLWQALASFLRRRKFLEYFCGIFQKLTSGLNRGYEEGRRNFRQCALCTLILISLVSCSATHIDSNLSHTYFNSINEAVVAATNRYNPISLREDREFMGTIYTRGDEYGYTVSSGRPGTGASNIHIKQSALRDVVAFWHTHGKAAAQFKYFSSHDAALVSDMARPLYLADYTGRLKVLEPHTQKLRPVPARGLGPSIDLLAKKGKYVRDASNRVVVVSTRRMVTD